MPADRALLSPEEVARLCGLSRRAVYDAIKRGELGAFRICSRLRISHAHLDQWLAGNAVVVERAPAVADQVAGCAQSVERGSFRARLAARKTA
jgi:excisionase family DNA binding protein